MPCPLWATVRKTYELRFVWGDVDAHVGVVYLKLPDIIGAQQFDVLYMRVDIEYRKAEVEIYKHFYSDAYRDVTHCFCQPEPNRPISIN